MPLSKKTVAAASAGIALVIVAGLVAVLTLFPPSQQKSIEREIVRANYCEQAADCQVLYGKCPFNCHVAVNVAEADRIAGLMEGFESNCAYMCIAVTGVDCVSGRCVARTEQPVAGTDEPAGPEMDLYMADDLGLTFSYRTEPDGYVLERRPDTAEVGQTTLLLWTRASYDEMKGDNPPLEGPPLISVQVFPDAGDDIAAWMESHPQYVGNVIAPSEPTTVGGKAGLRWRSDGLYVNDEALVLANGKAYLFSVGWFDENSPMRQDFNDILGSISFTAQ